MGSEMATSQDFVNWICSHELNPRFLMYVLLSEHSTFGSFASGTTHQTIYFPEVKAFHICMPRRHQQDQVVNVLSAYDELIENNSRRIEILEEMAQAIYREWFVEFRYPGHEDVPLVDSELGPIPEGWEASEIASITSALTRGIAPKYSDDASARVLNQKCIRGGRLNVALSRGHCGVVSELKRVRFGDVLINSTGVGTLGRVAQVCEELVDVTADSHVTIVRPNYELVDGDFFGLALLGLQDDFESLGVGSTGQTELSRARIGQMKLLLPSRGLQGAFGAAVCPMRSLAVILERENQVLRTTRDLLLPKLISGEIDVSELNIELADSSL
jgi:type I restriction enzyme S subunit